MSVASPLALALLAGCGLFGEGEDEQDMLVERSSSASVADGGAVASFTVDPDFTSFLLTATSERTLAITKLTDPNGTVYDADDWYGSPNSLTMAMWAQSTDAVINWPIREADGGLTPGAWSAELIAVNKLGQYASDGEIELLVQGKRDSNFAQGTVDLQIYYADGVRASDGVVEATESAVERLRAIWGSFGITANIEYGDSSVDPFLEYDASGNEAVGALTAGSSGRGLTLIIGEMVNDDYALYGVSGNIPGALISTDRSAVAVSWLTHAGTDGIFEENELIRFGETMAHELGHFMGLFHPVELGYDYWDALDDTPECGGRSDCEDAMSDNMMYPMPVCTSWTDCTEQEQLTTHQRGVLHRYGGVL